MILYNKHKAVCKNFKYFTFFSLSADSIALKIVIDIVNSRSLFETLSKN